MNKSTYNSPSLKEIKVKTDHSICQTSGGIIDSYVATSVEGGDDFAD